MKKWIWLVLNCCFLHSLPMQAQQATVEPTDREVAIAGMMRMVHGYGPPGYGEDHRKDLKVAYLALRLSFRVTTACTPQLPELRDIQCGSTNVLRLVFPIDAGAVDLKKKARLLEGHKVLVTGVLHRQESMADYTKVYMDVAEITALP